MSVRLAVTALAAVLVGASTLSLAGLAAAAPGSAGDAAALAYSVTGSAHVERSDTDLVVGPTTLVLRGLGEGRVTGDLPVTPSPVRFVTSNGRPATATVSFTQVGAVRGSIFPTAVGTALTVTGRYTMRLSDLRIDGGPLDLGPRCTTVTPVVMTGTTPATQRFSRSRGGSLEGTFAIPGWHHCNGAEPFIADTISGGGNTVTLVLRSGP